MEIIKPSQVIPTKKGHPPMENGQYLNLKRLTLVETLVRYSQFLTPFTTTSCQYFTTVLRCHTAAESVLVLSFSYRRLKRSFHDLLSLSLVVLNQVPTQHGVRSGCKDRFFFEIDKVAKQILQKNILQQAADVYLHHKSTDKCCDPNRQKRRKSN